MAMELNQWAEHLWPGSPLYEKTKELAELYKEAGIKDPPGKPTALSYNTSEIAAELARAFYLGTHQKANGHKPSDLAVYVNREIREVIVDEVKLDNLWFPGKSDLAKFVAGEPMRRGPLDLGQLELYINETPNPIRISYNNTLRSLIRYYTGPILNRKDPTIGDVRDNRDLTDLLFSSHSPSAVTAQQLRFFQAIYQKID